MVVHSRSKQHETGPNTLVHSARENGRGEQGLMVGDPITQLIHPLERTHTCVFQGCWPRRAETNHGKLPEGSQRSVSVGSWPEASTEAMRPGFKSRLRARME